MEEIKKVGGIYAIEDEAEKYEAVHSLSKFERIETLESFLKQVHAHGNDDHSRYYVCMAPASWDHCIENIEGASSPVDAARNMVELASEGWPIYVWDSWAHLSYRLDPSPYIFEAIESKKVGKEPLTDGSTSGKFSQASGAGDASLGGWYEKSDPRDLPDTDCEAEQGRIDGYSKAEIVAAYSKIKDDEAKQAALWAEEVAAARANEAELKSLRIQIRKAERLKDRLLEAIMDQASDSDTILEEICALLHIEVPSFD